MNSAKGEKGEEQYKSKGDSFLCCYVDYLRNMLLFLVGEEFSDRLALVPVRHTYGSVLTLLNCQYKRYYLY